jgi:hypothetical protein
MKALVGTYIRQEFPRTYLERNPDDPTYCLEPDPDFVQSMQGFIRKSQAGGQTSQDFLNRLKQKVIPLTFSAETAYERKLVEFITLRHPIARAAIQFWQSQTIQALPVANIVIRADPRFAGDHYFFIFALDARALKRSSTLIPVVVSPHSWEVIPDLGSQFLRLLQVASPAAHSVKMDRARFIKAKRIAKRNVAAERDRQEAELYRSNEALINARLEALNQTYQIKRDTAQEYLRKAADPRIRRMREGQLRNIRARHTQAVQELEARREVKVSCTLELAGWVRVLPYVEAQPTMLSETYVERT